MGNRKPSAKYLKFIVYLVVVILVNMAGTTLFFRVDLTENQAYSLSDASKRVVSSLSEPLTIKVFFSKNLPAPHNSTERYLHDLLEEYAAHANRYFNYRFYDVSADSGDISPQAGENQKLAENYGIHPIQIQAIEKDEVKFQKAYMGLVLIHGDIIERISPITDIDGLEYRLTTAIQKLNNKVSALLGLKEKIRVRLFLSSSLETVAPFMGLEDLPAIPEKIRSIVERLNRKNYGTLSFQYLDPTKDPGLEAETKKYNLLFLKWPAISQNHIPAGSGVSGLVMSYGNKAVTLPLIRVIRLPLIGTQYTQVGMEQIEEMIDGSLASLIDIHEDLGVLADHGTLNISGMAPPDPTRRQPNDVVSHRTLIKQNYTIKDVQLRDGIPAGVQCLLIARPTKKFTDYDLFQIDQFLMQGKSIALFLDTYDEQMPQGMMGGRQPQYVPIDTGLEKLLAHYGVRVKRSYVMDENCFKQRVPEEMGGGQRAIYFAPLIQNRYISKNHAFMRNIKGLIALKISPLALDDDRIRQSGVKADRLFASSERSWEMSGRINLNPMFLSPPSSADEQKSLPLAYLLEGEFISYFADKPIPERPAEVKKDDGDKTDKPADKSLKKADSASEKKPDSAASKIEGKGTIIKKGKPGKILLVGSSEMLRDTILSEEGRSPNAIFVMNVIDYLNNREDIAVMRSKQQRFNPLADTGPGVKTMVKALNIAGIPILVVCFGLLVWSRRHSRKKRIQMMFSK